MRVLDDRYRPKPVIGRGVAVALLPLCGDARKPVPHLRCAGRCTDQLARFRYYSFSTGVAV